MCHSRCCVCTGTSRTWRRAGACGWTWTQGEADRLETLKGTVHPNNSPVERKSCCFWCSGIRWFTLTSFNNNSNSIKVRSVGNCVCVFFPGWNGACRRGGWTGPAGHQSESKPHIRTRANVIRRCIFIALTDVGQTVSIIWKTDPRAVHSLTHTERLCLCSLDYSSDPLCLLLDIMTSGESHQTCREFIRLVFHHKIKRNKSPSGKKFSYVIQIFIRDLGRIAIRYVDLLIQTKMSVMATWKSKQAHFCCIEGQRSWCVGWIPWCSTAFKFWSLS